MSDSHPARLETWLQVAPHLPRADELVSPDGTAYCWLGGAAMVASLAPSSRIGLVGPSSQTGDAHFTVDDAAVDSKVGEDALDEAMTAWYGVDLLDTTIDPDTLPEPLRDELAAALTAAQDIHAKRWWMFDWAREGGGWPLHALSDLDLPSWLLARLTRQVLAVNPPVTSA